MPISKTSISKIILCTDLAKRVLMLVQMKALAEPCLTQDQATDQAGNLAKEKRMKRREVHGLDHGPMLSGDLTSLAHLKVLFSFQLYFSPPFLFLFIQLTQTAAFNKIRDLLGMQTGPLYGLRGLQLLAQASDHLFLETGPVAHRY